MISAKCFERDWVLARQRELKPVGPHILEKTIHALALLGHLAESSLPFVFKGGTSLILHLKPVRRLSIDIDIACGVKPAELDGVLAKISKLPPFTGYQEDARGERGLPHRRHFKFFYPSTNPKFGGHVLLDVVEESRCPHVTTKLPILALFIEVDREVKVTVPTVESLLADKLAAFAPHTVGVPLQPGKGRAADTMQIAKQLFDVGELFNAARDFGGVAKVYDGVFALENEYQNGRFTRTGALEDTVNASLALSASGLKAAPSPEDAALLLDGSKRLGGHLVQSSYGPKEARIAASKAALLSMALLRLPKGFSLDANRFQGDAAAIEALKTVQIAAGEWQLLNKIKATNPEAFHYWQKASVLLA